MIDLSITLIFLCYSWIISLAQFKLMSKVARLEKGVDGRSTVKQEEEGEEDKDLEAREVRVEDGECLRF